MSMYPKGYDHDFANHEYDNFLASPMHAEAPVSANCRLMIEGHEVQVTIRSGATPDQVELVMGTMKGVLRGYASPPYVAPPPASPPPAPPPTEREPEAPYCERHRQRFLRKEKDGQVWYSHKVNHPAPGESPWCRY